MNKRFKNHKKIIYQAFLFIAFISRQLFIETEMECRHVDEFFLFRLNFIIFCCEGIYHENYNKLKCCTIQENEAIKITTRDYFYFIGICKEF